MRTKTVETPVGDARLLIFDVDEPKVRLVLGHGAGGSGSNARDLRAIAKELPGRGITVMLMEQPWVAAGKRVGPRPEQLDRAWVPTLAEVAHDVPLVIGGRSAGARVACRTAKEVGADAVVALAFPLHPPWKPERTRFDELAAAGVPTLVVQGERDSFGAPDEFPSGDYTIATIPYANHSMAVPKAHSQEDALAQVIDAVAEFVIVQ